MKQFVNFAITIIEEETKNPEAHVVRVSQAGEAVQIPIEQLGIVINHLDEIYKAHHEEKE